MTFYIATALPRHVVVACDDRWTYVDPQRHVQHRPKIWHVGRTAVATGSGIMHFVEHWAAKQFPRSLADGIDLTCLRSSLPELGVKLRNAHRAVLQGAPIGCNPTATLLLGGISRSQETLLLGTCSPSFDPCLHYQGTTIAAKLSPENDAPAGLSALIAELAGRLRGLSEDGQIALIRTEFESLVMRIATNDQGVAPTGHVAVVGPDGVAMTSFSPSPQDAGRLRYRRRMPTDVEFLRSLDTGSVGEVWRPHPEWPMQFIAESDGEPLAYLALVPYEHDEECVELICVVSTAARRDGIGRDGCAALLALGASAGRRIVARVESDNGPGLALADALGLRRAGVTSRGSTFFVI